MRLTDIQVKRAKPAEKAYLMYDGRGLFLFVTPAGGKFWRWKYRVDGREKLMALGKYPDVSLADARERHAEEHRLLAHGQHPMAKRKMDKRAARLGKENSFRNVAALGHEHWQIGKSARHIDVVWRRLEADIFPVLGARPIHGAGTGRHGQGDREAGRQQHLSLNWILDLADPVTDVEECLHLFLLKIGTLLSVVNLSRIGAGSAAVPANCSFGFCFCGVRIRHPRLCYGLLSCTFLRSLAGLSELISVELNGAFLVPFPSEANSHRTSRAVADHPGERSAYVREYKPDAFLAGLSCASQ